MKKTGMQTLAALTAALMMLPLSSCAQGGGDETVSSVGTPPSPGVTERDVPTEPPFDPGIEKTDYHGEVNIACFGDFLQDYCFPSDDESGEMDPVLHERELRIQDQIGVEIHRVSAGDWIAYAGAVNRAVRANDDAYQIVLTHTYQGVPALISAGSLLDLKTLPSLHLDAPYWSQNVMESLKMRDHYYLGYSDYLLSKVDLITFNKDMMRENQMEYPYDLVRNKAWTLDRFLTMSSGIYEDLDHNGERNDKDRYSFCGWGWVHLIDFVTSCDIQIAVGDEEGHYHVAYDDKKEKFLSLTDRIYDWYNAESGYFWKSTDQGKGTNMIRMDEGRTMFGTMESSTLLTYRDSTVPLGILPYPLYDTEQKEYRALNWNGHICVPRSVRNIDMVSDTVELLSAYASPVREAFYNRLLGLKLSEAPDDAQMLDIIWDAQICDIGMTLSNLENMDNLVYMLPKMCEEQKKSYESFIKANQAPANLALKKFFARLPKE